MQLKRAMRAERSDIERGMPVKVLHHERIAEANGGREI
jgi:hypothetical protein